MKRVIASYNNLQSGSVSEQLIKTASCGLLRVLVQGELAGREARARAVFLTVSCDWRRAGHVTTILVSDWSRCTTSAATTGASSGSHPTPPWPTSHPGNPFKTFTRQKNFNNMI